MNPILATWLIACALGTLVNAIVLLVALRDVRAVRGLPDHDRLALVARAHVRNPLLVDVGLLGGLLAGVAVWLNDPLHPSMLLVNLIVWGLMAFPIFLTGKGLYNLLDRWRAWRLFVADDPEGQP